MILAERCLTVRQPWASMIIDSTKTVERRPWSTPYRGRLWIHSALTPDNPSGAALRRGVILGRVRLVDVVLVDGLWHWMLADAEPLPAPIPCRGRQSLWTLPDDLARDALAAFPPAVVAT